MLVRLVITSSIIVCGLMIIGIAGQRMLGTGKWSIINVQPCENDEKMPWRVRVRRHKLNRTHDAFDADVSVLEEIDDSYGGRADICKMVGGTCKPFSTRKTDCLHESVKKYGEESALRVFTYVGIDPPDFPIPKRDYHAENYIMDMSRLTKKSVYGDFIVNFYLVKDEMDLACTQLYLKFEPTDDDEDDD